MKCVLIKLIYAMALCLLVLTPWRVKAAGYCNIAAQLTEEASSEVTQYTYTATYSKDPTTGWRTESPAYAFTCTLDTGSSCASTEFSTSSNIATLTPSQSAYYTVTVTVTVVCNKYIPPEVTSTSENDADDVTTNVVLPTTTTGDDDDDDDDDDDTTTTTCTPSVSYYVDSDGDSYGSSSATAVLFCTDATTTETAGYVTDNTDCDDSVSTVHPGVSEDSRDTFDNNCDGVIADYYVTTVDPGTLTLTGDDDADDDDDPSTGGGGCALQNAINPQKPLWYSFGFFIFSLLFFWRRQTLTANQRCPNIQ